MRLRGASFSRIVCYWLHQCQRFAPQTVKGNSCGARKKEAPSQRIFVSEERWFLMLIA